jgi:Ca2+/Na+ antiporter
MREYSLKQEKFQSLFKRVIPVSLISVLFPIILFFILRSSLSDTPVIGFITVLCAILFLYRFAKETIKIIRIKRDWKSFKILYSDFSIIKKQDKTPDIEIMFREISRIIQVTGGISIQTEDPHAFIFIPSDLNNYEELFNKLNKLYAIEVSPIISVKVHSEYAIKQHNQPRTILKKLLIGIGMKFGGFILFLLLVIGLIFFLSH